MKAKEGLGTTLKTTLTAVTLLVLIATAAGAVVETRSRVGQVAADQTKLELRISATELMQRQQYEAIVRSLHALELRQAIIQERLEELRNHLIGE